MVGTESGVAVGTPAMFGGYAMAAEGGYGMAAEGGYCAGMVPSALVVWTGMVPSDAGAADWGGMLASCGE